MKWWHWVLLVGGGYWLWTKSKVTPVTGAYPTVGTSCVGVQNASESYLNQLLTFGRKLYGNSVALDCSTQAPNVGLVWGAGQYYAKTWDEVGNFVIAQAKGMNVSLT